MAASAGCDSPLKDFQEPLQRAEGPLRNTRDVPAGAKSRRKNPRSVLQWATSAARNFKSCLRKVLAAGRIRGAILPTPTGAGNLGATFGEVPRASARIGDARWRCPPAAVRRRGGFGGATRSSPDRQRSLALRTDSLQRCAGRVKLCLDGARIGGVPWCCALGPCTDAPGAWRGARDRCRGWRAGGRGPGAGGTRALPAWRGTLPGGRLLHERFRQVEDFGLLEIVEVVGFDHGVGSSVERPGDPVFST